MTKTITIATRESNLAMWQTKYVAALIEQHTPYQTQLLPMTTEGDQRLEVSLNKIGGKGLFLKELEQSMQAEESDIAVHSMKDVPADLPEGFTVCAVFPRADPADAFVSNQYKQLSDLPQGAVVGTSSLRRQSQLLALRPDLDVQPLRGNVNSRLAKLDDGQYDAIILAAAGLQRLGFDDRIASRLMAPDWLPAVSQGAIGIECLSSRTDLIQALSVLNDENTWLAVQAERALNAGLNGSCSVAIGAFAECVDDEVSIQAAVFSPDGEQTLAAHTQNSDPVAAGKAVANTLLAAGAQAILDLAEETG
ncbi:hydroxymethylbilane synthase [Marinicella rhabdoformis]|uniref:hydroxymethylbilane synthase n=1 Tax=Marinicella rhabdoformis TaxID=2580566 RepID=UPI0012AEB495|nr:hydroxymethylbilane synthase [Marinicella rhabdoformis]